MPRPRHSISLKALSTGLIEDIARWIPELQAKGLRSTLWFGILGKCIAEVDQILQLCVEGFLSFTGETGRLAASHVGGDKPIQRFTMGERVRLLKRLVPLVDRKFSPDAPINDPSAMDLLDTVVKRRNDFVHMPEMYVRRTEEAVAEATMAALTFLCAANDLCCSRLVEACIAIQEGRHTS
jgi:hypothetical protein